jgi:manganese-dependent inorganic pyrophosphatase
MKRYACGHKIPDLDSITSAISLSYLKSKLNEEVIPVRLGEPNIETKFVLEKFGFEIPPLKTSFSGDGLYITDHSDRHLAPDDLEECVVLGIIDHHKLGDITTSTPLECWIRPVGCTNTIIYDMYRYYDIQIPSNIASIMLCAILVDTVIFKSPTCTTEDKKAVKELSKISGIKDFKYLGIELFKIKSSIDGISYKDLLLRDYKEFNMNNNEVGIGQLEVIDISLFDDIKDELHLFIHNYKKEKNLHTVIVLLTDIMQEGSELLVSSNDNLIVEKSFNKLLDQNNRMWIDGCLSRKKQIIPLLEPTFFNN